MWRNYRNWHTTTADLSKDLRFAIRGLECYTYQIGTMGNLRFRKSYSHELTTSTTLTKLISLQCKNRLLLILYRFYLCFLLRVLASPVPAQTCANPSGIPVIICKEHISSVVAEGEGCT